MGQRESRRIARTLFEVRVCVVCHEVNRTGEAMSAAFAPGAADAGGTLRTTAAQAAGADAGTAQSATPLIGVPWKIGPVYLTQRWLPKARFEHAKHAAVECVSCHAVSQSRSSSDVSMPEIGKCRECHVGSVPERNRISSNCELCHGFHQHPLPMPGPGTPGHGAKPMAQAQPASIPASVSAAPVARAGVALPAAAVVSSSEKQ